ncbi:uncharacterized protein FN964_005553 isoform 1-T3 [Alca torda]
MRSFREAGAAPVSSERRPEGEPGQPGPRRAPHRLERDQCRPAGLEGGHPRSSIGSYALPRPRQCPAVFGVSISMAPRSSRTPEVPPQSSDTRLYGTLVLQEPGSALSVLRRASLWHFGPPVTRKYPLSPPTRVSMALRSSRNPEVPSQSSDARLYGTSVLQEPGSALSVLRRASLWHFGPPGTRKYLLSPPTRVSMALWSSRNPEVPSQSSDARLYGTSVLQEPGSALSVLRRASLWHFGPPGTRKYLLSPPTRVSMALWSSRNPEVPSQSSDARLYGTVVLQEPGSALSVLRRASLWHFGPPGSRKFPLSPPTRVSMAL